MGRERVGGYRGGGGSSSGVGGRKERMKVVVTKIYHQGLPIETDLVVLARLFEGLC